jgi:hypothetical protein
LERPNPCYLTAYDDISQQNAAVKKLSQEGSESVEAYLANNPKSDACKFPGPLSMYLKKGFTQYRDNDRIW